ncbi:unnamed protein product [Meganyctiphanes norvegica]|uniref:Uncharacterized protein n=1 Tax=Meganyctiphanes norvegica TaxID=48144 RepID=A0AAV2RHR5_MEGNR
MSSLMANWSITPAKLNHRSKQWSRITGDNCYRLLVAIITGDNCYRLLVAIITGDNCYRLLVAIITGTWMAVGFPGSKQSTSDKTPIMIIIQLKVYSYITKTL